MQRDLTQLTGRRHDLLVIGGGIHGLFAAWDAAERGLTVALVEREDFGSGLSFNHQRTIHGGLRSLQRGNLLKTRRMIRERRAWARLAPHLIRPLPFLIGTYRFTTRSRMLVRGAFKLYDIIGRRRNAGISPELHLPRAKLESAAATRRLFPGVREAGLSGGAVWYDYQIRHPERLNWLVAHAAREAGATLANHLEAIEPLRADGRVTGARVTDRLSEASVDIEAGVTLLAAGGGLAALSERFGSVDAPPMMRAMNLLVDRPNRDIAVVAAGSSGRMLTAVPWCGKVLVGTFQSAGAIDAADAAVPAGFIDECLADANAAFPELRATRGDLLLVHHGLTPASGNGHRADLLAEPRVLKAGNTPGLVSLVGVKYTTARGAASRAVDEVCRQLGRSRGRSPSPATTLPHAGIADDEGRLVEALRALGLALDRDIVNHLTSWYGTEAPAVVAHAAEHHLLERLIPGLPVLAGEVSYAATHLMAVTLSDVVLRRLPLACAGHPGADVLTRAAQVMASHFNWDEPTMSREIAALEGALLVTGP